MSRADEEHGEALLGGVRVAVVDLEIGELRDQRERVGRAMVVLNDGHGDTLEEGVGDRRDKWRGPGPGDECRHDGRRVGRRLADWGRD